MPIPPTLVTLLRVRSIPTSALLLFAACGGGDASPSADAGTGDGDAADAVDAATEDLVVPTIEQVGCWTIETLAGAGVDAVSLVLDPAGGAHLAYLEGDEAIYARAVTGGYARTVVGDVDPSFDSKTDLAVGPDGAAHLAYYMAVGSGPGDQLGHVYATNAGGGFVVRPLRDGYAKAIDDVSLAVDPDGVVHAVVSSSTLSTVDANDVENEIAYLTCSGARCEDPQVLFTETASFACADLTTAQGPAGRLDALWEADLTSSFMYRPDVTGDDASQTILSGYHTAGSLALDASGDAVVALADNHDTLFADRLQVATNRSGAWALEEIPIDPVPRAISATSAGVDPADGIHVALFGDGLTYATNASGSWAVTHVAPTDTAPVLRIDRQGRVHIAWGAPEGARHAVCAD